MITYPLSQKDLIRSFIARVPAAQVVYHDAQIQKFAADALKGLCTMAIVKGPEIKETRQVYDINRDEWREHTTTVQQHFVEVQYHNPEDEFEVKLSI